MKPSNILGVDVGGTFTDLLLFDAETKAFRTAKVPSQRGDEAAGFMQGIAAVGVGREIGSIVHGTTVGTNSLLERRGHKVGVITTRGFRDVLEMRRRDRRRTWGLWGDFTPIVDRDFRMEVDERTLADGTIHREVDEAEVRAAAIALRERGAEALAIIFINTYANPANEQKALAAAKSVWHNEFVSASHQVLPEIREFERSSTTALNSYLQPGVSGYLARLEKALETLRFKGQFYIVQSNGGVMSTATARRFPVRTALSGPAAGVIAAAAIARQAGYENAITCDLGGTSFDVSVIAGGRASLAAQATIDFGLVIRTPMIEITTIGAGGGSIASVDRGGLLQVGPESAGSVPGPACYGQGNERPTLTDAHVVLGRINANRPIGGKLARLDVEAASRAILNHVGHPLGIDVLEAAEAIVRVANARMAGAIRLVSIERGHDPTKFVGVPFGGGGALHVGAIVKEIGLQKALVPRFPGVTSALGCVIADLRHDQVQTLNLALDGIDIAALDHRMVAAGEEVRAVVSAAGAMVEPDRPELRVRHALCRTNPHRCRTGPGHAARRHHRHFVCGDPHGFRNGLCFVLQPPAVGPADQDRVAAGGRDRPPSATRSFRVRARAGGIGREGEVGHAAGADRWRVARDPDLVAPRSAGRRDRRGAGHPGTAGRDDLH